MRDNYRILSIGYCDAQSLLAFESPVAYSSGAYGWCCDYYYIGDVVVSTGYSPISSKNMRKDYDLVKQYEEKARKLNTREEHKKLLLEFIEAMKE